MAGRGRGIAVIGLGRFGRAVARTLASGGKPVLAIDANEKLVQEIAGEVGAAVSIDTTDVEALQELDIAQFECVIVGIGEASREASILTTAQLSSLGVGRIIARATDDLHARVLRAVGAHETVNPEAEIGARLGRLLSRVNVLEQMDLGPDATLAEIDAPAKWSGKTLVELDLRKKHGITVVAIKRGEAVIAAPQRATPLNHGDTLIVIGQDEAIDRISRIV